MLAMNSAAANESAPGAGAAGGAGEAADRAPKVLVVDDHALVRRGLMSLVGDMYPEATLVEASSGAEACAAVAADEDLDLVLLDLRLPDREGLGVLEEMVATRPGLPVAIVSVSEDPRIMAEAFRKGARGFMVKAASDSVLRVALPLILSGETYVPAAAMTALRDPGVAAQVGNPAAAAGLTPRQSEILQFMAKGFSNKEIGAELGMTEGTVKVHVKTILAKLEAANRTQAVIKAIRLGIVPRSVLDEIDD